MTTAVYESANRKSHRAHNPPTDGWRGLERLEERVHLSATDPSGREQAMLEWINRMRADPATELPRLVDSGDYRVENAMQAYGVDREKLAEQFSQLTPAPPVAWNAALYRAAVGHNHEMIRQQVQSHQLPGEPDVPQRYRDRGYEPWAWGENTFAYSQSVFHGHAAFAIDWGHGEGGIQNGAPHRRTIMDRNVKDVGISVVRAPDDNALGPWVITQSFSNRQINEDKPPFLLGVVFKDRDSDGQYDAGEGLKGVKVRIEGANGTRTRITRTAGGYQLRLPAGDYTVRFSGQRLTGTTTKTVTIGDANAKVDLIAAAS